LKKVRRAQGAGHRTTGPGAQGAVRRATGPGPRTAVFAYHTMGCVGLEALLAHGFDVRLVVSHRDDPLEEVWWGSVAALAESRGIPVLYPADPKDPGLAAELAGHAPDFIFSFYYRHMIPTPLLDLAARGAYNLHGSLLPRYRGRAPVNWVLVNGETETGVSLHRMVAKPDAGALVAQHRVAIADHDTAYSLYSKLETAARALLGHALPALSAGTAVETPMDLAAGSYFGARKPADGRIDWTWPSWRIYNLVRAVTHPYPGAFTELGEEALMVWWALPVDAKHPAAPGTVLAVNPDGITVATGSGAIRLVTVQQAGRPELPAVCFAAVANLLPGGRLGSAPDPNQSKPVPSGDNR
jgi:methionyl-tRNA formyltransferase